MSEIKRIYYIIIAIYLSGILSAASAGTDGDYLAITEIVQAVSVDSLMNTVSDLQENRDVNDPDKLYESRYCLRVRDSSDTTDGACDNAADYIFNRFASYGLDVEYDPFVREIEGKGTYTMRNVVATLPGKGPNSDQVYVICAHYDSFAGLQAGWIWDWRILPAPGADDNASGTAAVIEAARLLSEYDFNSTIKFIAFSGEELGMFGSKHYASAAAAFGEQIAGVINLDMIGYDPNELDIDIVSDEDSQWLGNAIYNTGQLYDVALIVNRIINPQMYFSDHASFWKSGYSAVLVIEDEDKRSDEYSPGNHSPDDTIDKINSELFLKSARLAIASLSQLADPITGPDDVIDPDLLVESDSVIFSHVPSRRGDSVAVNAIISNRGPGGVEDISVQVELVSPVSGEPPEIVDEWTLDMGDNISREISASFVVDEWGDYQVIVKVNTDARVFESDFTNNLARRTISISARIGVADLVVYPNPANMNERTDVNLKYKLSRDASVALKIYNISGRLVYNEDFAPGENGGRRGPENSIQWNGANQNLNPVAPGIYICQIVAADDRGEKQSAFEKLAVLR